MESGQKIEAGESNTHPSSQKLSPSLSSAISNPSTDSSFELIVDVPDQFIGGPSDSSEKNEFVFVNGDDLETRPPMTDLSSAAKATRGSLSRSSSSASESSLHDHVIELAKPENDQDTKAMADNVESQKDPESEHKVKLQQSGDASDNLSSNNHRTNSSPGSEVATQYPPTQLMERVNEDLTSPGYRIPSHVFSRTKSKSPMDQGCAASNESLFSTVQVSVSMESGQKIEAGESNTHPSSSTGEVGISTPSKKLSSSLSSSSNTSTDSSFELINVPDQFIGGASDSLKKNELHNAECSDSEFVFVNGDETCPPKADLSSAAKTTRCSLSGTPSSYSESSLHDHGIELSKPDKDAKAMKPDLNKALPGSRLGGTDTVESQKDLQIKDQLQNQPMQPFKRRILTQKEKERNQRFKEMISHLPNEPTTEDYVEVPVDGFGQHYVNLYSKRD